MQSVEYWPLSHELQDLIVVAIAKESWQMMCNLVLWAHCLIIFILLCFLYMIKNLFELSRDGSPFVFAGRAFFMCRE
jgi:hypothetical protein